MDMRPLETPNTLIDNIEDPRNTEHAYLESKEHTWNVEAISFSRSSYEIDVGAWAELLKLKKQISTFRVGWHMGNALKFVGLGRSMHQ